MSAALADQAGWEAGPLAAIWKQVFHRVPKIPAHINMRDKTAVVTGSSSGLGLECARQFLQLGVAKLILAVRSQSKGDAAAKQLLAEHPGADIQVWLVDMESDTSVREFAARCSSSLDRLDVVILNAGCGKQTFQRSNNGKGREVTLQVNYLATVLLAILLIPILKAKTAQLSPPSPGRLTLVTSDLALWLKMKEPTGGILDSMDNEAGFHGMDRYSKSKLLLTMFISKLAQHVNSEEVIINTVNPSAVRGTDLMRDAQGQYLIQAMVFLSSVILGRNLEDGTRQYLHASLVLGKESQGSFVDWLIKPYPTVMYTDMGHRMMDKLWHETIEELKVKDNIMALDEAKS
ncbi:hypothetical protein BX600DRAFT_486789 [Xylariales sp. PMI_506]|nr:hypothetical protein BX600DRAFT_486789 [Xylariales sp. PMI_506]